MDNKIDSNPYTNPFHSVDDTDWVKKIEFRYEFEDILRDFVMRGDAENAVKFWRDHYFSSDEFDYLMPNNLLELSRRKCRIVNVSLRIAARLGGLEALHLHNISEKFGLIISSIDDIGYLEKELIPIMIYDYSTAVSKLNTLSYGELVNKAIHYISLNIYEKIDLSIMSKDLFVSQGHLSRQFKAETKLTIFEFINMQRVEIAKLLLLHNKTNILELSLKLGYHDSSHFCRAFKQITGITPSKFQQQNKSVIATTDIS